MDTSRIGKLDGLTLVDALKALRETAGKPVALIVDEAQHALTSNAGEAAMSALKSARDQINRPGEVNLMLVMSGSDRNKLLRLVNTAASPFYGSQIQRMPPLGPDFIAFIARRIEEQRPELRPADTAMLQAAFERFGNRPQFFMEALGQALSPLATNAGRFEPAVLDSARQRQQDDESQMESDYLCLKPVEQAVLWRMLEQGPRFRPCDADALKFNRAQVGKAVSAPIAQNALEVLRQRTPPLVWKSARGEYAVEDAAMHRWFEDRNQAGKWPPHSPQGDLDLAEPYPANP
ncbi:MAG: ATP-binding protein [Rhodocyclales bacterium]|nr:ATP-binding protein [Rhodocyclales bacterium]